MIELLRDEPLTFFLVVGILLFSLTLHEIGHALSASWSGDQTARLMGRISLNPFRHLDPWGTLLLLFAGFGWARPVPIDPRNFRNYRLGLFVVSIAGIVVNLAIALLCALLLRGLDTLGVAMPDSTLTNALLYAAAINITLAVFNLLPVPPLDGSKIVQSLLPLRWHPFIWRLEANPNYAIIALLLFLTVLRGPVMQLIRFVQIEFFKLTLG
ncbi:site-2 protease family protein [Calidithermus roseus]|uniref:site-2 protease family protein n=1 Tax=Calidithermus roseus TaxID=1644118 RepID=UPI0015FB4675|nr:site-2 protease family protein [Calidithermus roseus]